MRCRLENKDPNFGQTVSPGQLVRIFADDGAIAEPAENDVVAISGVTYTIRAVRPGNQGAEILSWVCDVDRAP